MSKWRSYERRARLTLMKLTPKVRRGRYNIGSLWNFSGLCCLRTLPSDLKVCLFKCVLYSNLYWSAKQCYVTKLPRSWMIDKIQIIINVNRNSNIIHFNWLKHVTLLRLSTTATALSQLNVVKILFLYHCIPLYLSKWK